MAKTYSASGPHGTVHLRYEPSKLDELLKGDKMQRKLLRKAEKVRDRASSMYGGRRYGARVTVGKKRAHGVVYTADRHAMRSNVLHNTLQKALGNSKG